MLILTDKDIRAEIRGFEQRIQKAKDQLSVLPVGRLPFKQHKRRERKRRDLHGEIVHVRNLIKILEEALEEYA
jgi:hypothetical protein